MADDRTKKLRVTFNDTGETRIMALHHDTLAKTVNTLRTIPGYPNPFAQPKEFARWRDHASFQEIKP